jgi:hypothetical protein
MAVLPCLKSGIAIVRSKYLYVSQMVMTLLHLVQSYIYVYLNLKTLIQLQTQHHFGDT